MSGDRRKPDVTMAHRVKSPTHLAAEQLVGADGSIWSHAATLGTRIKGSEFTIDQAVVENFIRVFTTGYPCKVPVDYEHGTVNGATSTGQPVPKAGDVLELKGIFATSDFTGELKTTAEKLSGLAGRSLDDARNLGLWMRWKPTSRALGMIQGGEYSELSIAFAPVPHNTTGADQGEVLISVALTNLPFLDDMLPVAASRDLGGSPPAAGSREEQMTPRTITMFAAVAALAAKPVTDEEQAITELTALQPDVTRLRALGAVVAKAFGGETDPEKIGAKITELTSTVATLTASQKAERTARIATSVEAFLVSREKKIGSVPLRAMFARQLTGELEAAPDTKPEATETAKTIDSLPDTSATTQSTSADTGTGASDDVKLDAKAKELMASDAGLKELSAKSGFGAAFARALTMASEQLGLNKKSAS